MKGIQTISMKKIIVISGIILVVMLGGIFMFSNLFNRNNNQSADTNYNLSDEEEIVLNRYKEMEQAMVDKDIDKLNKIVKDGTTFTHMSGKTQSKSEYFEDIRTGALDYQSYTIGNPSVTIEGNKAILKARVTLTANAYGAQGSWPFNVSAYFEKVNNEWLYTNKF